MRSQDKRSLFLRMRGFDTARSIGPAGGSKFRNLKQVLCTAGLAKFELNFEFDHLLLALGSQINFLTFQAWAIGQ